MNLLATHNPDLADAIIVDIDGTIAQSNGKRGWYEWDKIYEDDVRKPILELLHLLYLKYHVLFVTGRDSGCREYTEHWLDNKAGFSCGYNLYMRPAGDRRPDTDIKRELYERYIKNIFNVHLIFEDRPSVVREWQRLGFGDRILNVGDGTEF